MTYVVTGSESGMGLAIRNRLRSRGETVLGIDRTGGDVVADLSTSAGRHAAVAAVAGRCSSLSGVVASAGVAWPNPDPGLIVSTNFFGVRDLLDGLHPLLAAAGDCRVVVVASMGMAVTPGAPDDLVGAMLDGDEDLARVLAKTYGDHAAYTSSKLAISRWARRKAPRPDWAGIGIRLNVIAPGVTLTPMVEKNMAASGASADTLAQHVPLGLYAEPEDMAAAFDALLLDAGKFICGQVIFVDGGWEASLRANDWPVAYTP